MAGASRLWTLELGIQGTNGSGPVVGLGGPSVLRKVSRNSLVVVISADAEIACRSIGFPTASGDRLAQSLLRIRHTSRRTGSITHAIAASPRESGPIPYAEALPLYSVHPEGTVFVSAPQARVGYWIGLRN